MSNCPLCWKETKVIIRIESWRVVDNSRSALLDERIICEECWYEEENIKRYGAETWKFMKARL